jgi:hypothetical protein
MTRPPMTSTDKVRSYLRNRAGVPVTNEDIAIGAKLKLGTVGPIVARLIDRGEVVRTGAPKKNRAGQWMTTVLLAEFWTGSRDALQPREKPIPRKDVARAADFLEACANRVLTSLDTGVDGDLHPTLIDALNLLRIARDGWRDAKRKQGSL